MRRILLFVRDYCEHVGVAWSLARMHDCERNGGHRFASLEFDQTLQAWGRTCSRCKCWRSSPEMTNWTAYTTASGATAVWPSQ